MISITTILLPTDGSECSKKAMAYALFFSKLCGARVVGLYVTRQRWEWRREPGFAEIGRGEIVQKIRREDEEEERGILQEIADAAAPLGVAVETRIVTGTPVEQILRLAKELAVDLIIMGTHGRTGFSHVFMGSVAETVVRRAPCPVLTVRPREGDIVAP
jgi:universal stress protein A